MPQELGHIDVTQRAQQQHLLNLLGASTLQVACKHSHVHQFVGGGAITRSTAMAAKRDPVKAAAGNTREVVMLDTAVTA
jgi:hypothetical protein